MAEGTRVHLGYAASVSDWTLPRIKIVQKRVCDSVATGRMVSVPSPYPDVTLTFTHVPPTKKMT